MTGAVRSALRQLPRHGAPARFVDAPGVAPSANLLSIRVTDSSGTSDIFTISHAIVAAVDARKAELFYAFYRQVPGGVQRVQEPACGSVDDLIGGRIEIEYYGQDDLQRILNVLGLGQE